LEAPSGASFRLPERRLSSGYPVRSTTERRADDHTARRSPPVRPARRSLTTRRLARTRMAAVIRRSRERTPFDDGWKRDNAPTHGSRLRHPEPRDACSGRRCDGPRSAPTTTGSQPSSAFLLSSTSAATTTWPRSMPTRASPYSQSGGPKSPSRSRRATTVRRLAAHGAPPGSRAAVVAAAD